MAMIIAHPQRRSRQEIGSEIAAHGPSHLVQQIKSSSQNSGVSFGYMVATARVESNFDPQARAKTSSASGLYQFTNGTWLNLVRNHGRTHGLGALASQIDAQGQVADPATREAILALRHDPKIAIELGIEFTRENQAYLEKTLNRTVSGGELYLAHFLGASQAGQFLAAIDKNPHTKAADLFPKAAAANRAVFFDPEGNAKSVAAILQSFSHKIDAKVTALALATQPKVTGDSPAADSPAADSPASPIAATRPRAPSVEAYSRYFMAQPESLGRDGELWLRLLMPREEDPNRAEPSQAALTLAPTVPAATVPATRVPPPTWLGEVGLGLGLGLAEVTAASQVLAYQQRKL